MGISIVISGLIDPRSSRSPRRSVSSPTRPFSLWAFTGRRPFSPGTGTRQITTMCGHGMVGAENPTKVVMERVKAGKMTPKKGAHLLARSPVPAVCSTPTAANRSSPPVKNRRRA